MDDEKATKVTLARGSLGEYFGDSVDGAIGNLRIDLDPHTRAYLVNLLTTFAEREALLTDELEDLLEKPIAIQMLQAVNAPVSRRFHTLKQIGDYSLYLTGFFSASFSRSLVDDNYYMTMGSGAYRQAASTLTRGGEDNPFRQLFSGLADRFRELVDVLNEVSERCFDQDQDLLRLYDRFLSTGSRRLAARLAGRGVAVGATPRFTQ